MLALLFLNEKQTNKQTPQHILNLHWQNVME